MKSKINAAYIKNSYLPSSSKAFAFVLFRTFKANFRRSSAYSKDVLSSDLCRLFTVNNGLQTVNSGRVGFSPLTEEETQYKFTNLLPKKQFQHEASGSLLHKPKRLRLRKGFLRNARLPSASVFTRISVKV